MKKLLIILASIMFALVACDNGGMKENEKPDINPETNSPYYPFEVSNVRHELSDNTITFTWDNPTDGDFDHVWIKSAWLNISLDLPSGQNYYTDPIGGYLPMDGKARFELYCIDKDGRKSEGVIHRF